MFAVKLIYVILLSRYYYYLYFLLSVAIPVFVPVYFFGDSLVNAFLACYAFRYVFQLNGTWLVNSAAHLYGTRPYDKNLPPVESWFVSFLSLGEGWHNYHHAFPWDYKAAELSELFNFTADIIKFFEKVGLAYDLKTASPEMVKNRIIKTGDGTHAVHGNDEAKTQMTAWGPLHPLNPSFNSKFSAPDAVLTQRGLPLYHENDVFDSQDSVVKRNVSSA